MKIQHVVITGGSRGLGRALAAEFLKSGCRVTINGKNSERLIRTVNDFRESYPGRIAGFTADVTNRDTLEVFCRNAVSANGEIDIWINNAGIDQPRKNFWELNEEDSRRIVDVNLQGVINGCSVAAIQMLKQGRGRIYNMEGLGSDGRKLARYSFYGATKHALRYLTESFAVELRRTPVSVASLSPGIVVTDFLLDGLPDEPAARRRVSRFYNILADRPEDVAVFLAAQMTGRGRWKKRIAWLTGPKVLLRFLGSPFSRRAPITSDNYLRLQRK